MPRTVWAAAQLAGTVLFIAGCARGDKAGRAARATESCAQLCRLVVRSSEPAAIEQCYRGCRAQVFAVGPACEDRLHDWVDCARAKAEREKLDASDADTAGLVAHYCPRELSYANACAKASQSAGIVQNGEQRVQINGAEKHVLYEVKYEGGFDCVGEPGAAARAPCTSAKLCASKCYYCGTAQYSLRLRACIDGQCVDKTELDAFVPMLDVLENCHPQN